MELSINTESKPDPAKFLVNAKNFDLEQIREAAVLLFDKPAGWSSFKLVKKVKFLTKAARVGHAGTLDPLATGLLIICTGKCTRMIESVQAMEKTYTGLFRFGKTTPSFDLETEFDAEYAWDHITPEMISQTTAAMTGNIEQIPPVYSAIKVNGTRAYKFARQGRELELKSRPVQIHDFRVSGTLPDLGFEVVSSKGTYIRTLANDFGKALNSGCYLDRLRRTQTGKFRVEDAFDVESFQELCGF